MMSPSPTQQTPHSQHSQESSAYESPGFEVISLDCEISAYAPDGDDERPLF